MPVPPWVAIVILGICGLSLLVKAGDKLEEFLRKHQHRLDPTIPPPMSTPSGDYSFVIPAGWKRYEAVGSLSKPTIFRNGLGTIEISVSYGPSEYENKESRSKAM